jgi:hypothetical protein
MISGAPQIGFDRFIKIEWVGAALNVRNGSTSITELTQMLEASGLGKEALAKTMTKLNAIVIRPREDLADFVDRGRMGIAGPGDDGIAAYAWAVCLATYPFFGKVAEVVGRLTSIQGDCSIAEIHRRMSEAYGDREITKRATQAVLQTQSDWGVVRRVDRGKRLVRLESADIDDDTSMNWLIEAAVRYAGKSILLARLQSLPVLFPFNLTRVSSYRVSNSPALELRSEGPNNQVVALRSGI